MSRYEIDKLQLGWFVEKEREAEQQDAQRGQAMGKTGDTARRKREHKQSIERRLREQ